MLLIRLNQLLFFAFVVLLLISLELSKRTLFIFINYKYVKTLSFLFFSLINVSTRVPKVSHCCLWWNNVSTHFLFVASQALAMFLNSFNSSTCDFSRVVLAMNSLFSSSHFYMSALIFCSFFVIFVLQIFMLCYFFSISPSPCPIPLAILPFSLLWPIYYSN